MTTSKINSFKVVANMALLVIFLYACAQPNKKAAPDNPQKAANAIQASKPKMDLHAAIIAGNMEVVRQHIEAGTNIDRKDELGGSTPLMSAIIFGKTDIARALIDAGANLSLKNNDGATALHVAAFFCRIEMVQLLLDANADRSAKNNFGATARETVIVPFADVKPIYEMIQLQLEPLDIRINLKEIEKNRPVVAMMLQ